MYLEGNGGVIHVTELNKAGYPRPLPLQLFWAAVETHMAAREALGMRTVMHIICVLKDQGVKKQFFQSENSSMKGECHFFDVLRGQTHQLHFWSNIQSLVVFCNQLCLSPC